MGNHFTKLLNVGFLHARRRRKALAPTALCSGPFNLLPLEMVLYLATFLPTSSAAALALCNRYLSRALREYHWNLLRSTLKERAIFLQCLERDLPEYLFCDRCTKLHFHGELGKAAREHRCNVIDQMDGTIPYYHSRFQFEHVQMAMKRHRSGRDTKACLAHLAPGDATIRGPHNLYFFEARIVADEFFVRVQHWLFVPVGEPFKVPRHAFKLCHHLRTDDFRSSFRPDNKLISTLSCKIEHANDKLEQLSCERCSGLRQCDFCPTDFRVDLQSFPDRGTAVIVTKWMNLGAGKSRSDPKWRTHLRNMDDAAVLRDLFCDDPAIRLAAGRRFIRESDGPFAFEAGSVRAAFENKADFGFESLATSKYISTLLADGKRR